MRLIAPNLWIKSYPLSLLGGHQGRVCTIVRLSSGRLIIHSTAPFALADVAEIHALGISGWLVDSMLRHDTFSEEGRAIFPDIPYLVPPGFPKMADLRAQPILPAPPEWTGEVEVLRIDGMPQVEEHVFLHKPSRTLIVADLVFNFAPATGWTSFMRRTLMGVKEHPDAARVYPLQVKDRAAYNRSIEKLFTWDFDHLITGHNEPIMGNAKPLLRAALARKNMMPAKC
jgi:hypothetical protein